MPQILEQHAGTPPKLAISLLGISLPLNVREAIIGDLSEEFLQQRLPAKGKLAADLWFWKQTLLATYEYLNKQPGGMMAFIISIFIFVIVTLMAMWMAGDELSIFIDVPSFIVTIPPAIAFGIAASSIQSMKLCVKLCISEQGNIEPTAIKSAIRFARVTGNSVMYLSAIFTLVGAVAIASNVKAEVFGEVFGPAFAVCVLVLFYGFMLKLLCYVAEQRIMHQYLSD